MDIHDTLELVTQKIVRNAVRIHRKKGCGYPLWLSRNGNDLELDIISTSRSDINSFIKKHKPTGRFYLIGVNSNSISPRRLLLSSPKDFLYTLLFSRFLSSIGDFSFKQKIYRMLGMKIGRNVHIYEGVKFDIFLASLIEVGDNVTIGGNALFYNHTSLASKDYFGWGVVKIGNNCLIGNGSFIGGLRMGDNSMLKPATVTAGYLFDLESNTLYG